MRVYKLKRETQQGCFSLNNWQLYVGELSDAKNNKFKGMSILGAHDMFEFPFKVSQHDAKRFISAIDSILNNRLPVKYSLKTGSNFLTFNLKIGKQISNWHGGGGFKGSASLTTLGIFGSYAFVTISKSTLQSLKKCLGEFYEL